MMIVPIVLAILAPGAPPDEAALRALPESFVQAWERADARGLSALFAPEADLVIPTGASVSGRPAIESFYRGAFAQGYSGTRVVFTLRSVREPRPDTAILDGSWAILKSGEPSEEGLFCAVLGREGGTWQVLALREMVPLRAPSGP
jgi:uncharacterized protein (TIGR02246 family)